MADESQFQANLSQVPVSSLARVIARGLDPAKVHSCAVPKKDAVKGCPYAANCAKRMFGRPENGGFGPKHSAPGTPGTHPRYIGYFDHDVASNTSREDFALCHHFMAGKYDRFRQQDEHGNFLEIVAQEGEVIERRYLMPMVADVPGEKPKSSKLKLVVEHVEVPTWSDPLDVVPRVEQRMAEREARRSRMAEYLRGPARELPGVTPEPVGVDPDEFAEVVGEDADATPSVVAERVPSGRSHRRG